MVGFVGTAAAHTNSSKAECVDDTTTLTVNLTAYSGKHDNSVKITDGETVLDENADFGKEYSKVFEVPGDVEHLFTIDVKAGDNDRYSFTKEYKVEACVETPPPSSSEPSTPPVETTTETPAPPTSSEAPPAPTTPPTTTTTEQEEVLAETGASVALPLGIAGVLIVGGAGALFVVRRRSKA